MPPLDLTEHVLSLIHLHMTLAEGPGIPVVKHWTTDKHYPGVDCLSMGERSFGRMLALWEDLFGPAPRIGLREDPRRPGVWDCRTPNRDRSESHHRLYAQGNAPWRLDKVEHLPGQGEREVPTPFSVWANLDGKARFNPDGSFANLRAWNEQRAANNLPPMVADPVGDDKHIMLLAACLQQRFSLWTKAGEVHPSTLDNILYGYQNERREWLTEAELQALAARPADDEPSIFDDPAPLGGITPEPYTTDPDSIFN